MPRIKITTPDTPGLHIGRMVRMWVDNVEIQDLVDVDVKLHLDEAVTVTAKVLGRESLKFEGSADLRYEINLFPGYRLVETPLDNGRKSYHIEPMIPAISKTWE